MKFYTLLLAVSAVLLSNRSFAQLSTGDDVAVTETTSGKVRGFIHNDIYTYRGIPYGVAKRFETAQAPEPWEGIRSSTTWGPVAPLMNPISSVNDEVEFVFDHDWGYTSEDCLVLNVWTPGTNDGKKRPVMFWIHGGGFTAGSSQELPSYHGENLARKGDVVVVSINHRLNVLGFLDLSSYDEKYATSANNSMLDIQKALEWTRDNISNFGGDPGNVTIFGQSGGGAKVNTLMAMPGAKGLFHKAINQSGAFGSETHGKEITQQVSAEVIKELGISEDQIDEIQSVPFKDLAAAGQKALRTIADRLREEGRPVGGFGLGWGPSMDGKLIPHQIASDEAYELSRHVPLMIGTVKNEFMPSLGAGLTHASMKDVMNHLEEQHGDKAAAFVAAAKEAYPNYKMPSDLIDIDTRFRPGAIYQANKKSALSGGASVYSYIFKWQSPVFDGKYKAIHCIEIPFAFFNIDRCENMTGATPEAHILAEKVSNAWINFAHHGDPNHSGLPEWPKYSEENGANMLFDNQCEVRNHHDRALLELVISE